MHLYAKGKGPPVYKTAQATDTIPTHKSSIGPFVICKITIPVAKETDKIRYETLRTDFGFKSPLETNLFGAIERSRSAPRRKSK